MVTPCDGAALRGILSLLGCGPSNSGFSARRPGADSTHILRIWGRWNVGQRPLIYVRNPLERELPNRLEN